MLKKSLLLVLTLSIQSVSAELDGQGSEYWCQLVKNRIGEEEYNRQEEMKTLYRNGALILALRYYAFHYYDCVIKKHPGCIDYDCVIKKNPGCCIDRDFYLNQKLTEIEEALQEGANPNTLVTPSETALNFAISRNYTAVVKLLSKYKPKTPVEVERHHYDS